VVHGERHGREVVYQLVDEHLAHIVADAVAHVEESR
jgi:ArsR family transcriptional regulator